MTAVGVSIGSYGLCLKQDQAQCQCHSHCVKAHGHCGNSTSPPPPFFFFPFFFTTGQSEQAQQLPLCQSLVSGPHSCWVSSRLTTHNESWPGAYKPLSNNRMITLFPTVICLLTGAFAGATYFSIENLAMHFAKNIFSQARFRTQHLPQPQSPLYDVTSTSQA